MKQINFNEFQELATKGYVIVDFNATWCGPCRMLGPVLEEIAGETPDVSFFGVDCDENEKLCQQFGITNIPCVVALKDGKEVARSVGFKPKDQMVEFVNSNK